VHRAFNISNFDWANQATQSEVFKQNNNKEIVREKLESCIQNGIIDGTNLGTQWFPTVKADVFISHSHADEDIAIRCAAWLKENFGLESFIDSCVWGHADKLLKIIDDQYCLNPGSETYDYQKRNQSTSHIHMMLATAITEMINATECIFFLNSGNSINSLDAISKTKSPWLFYELGVLRTIQRTVPARLLTQNFTYLTAKSAAVPIEHTVQLTELTTLKGGDINFWCLKSLITGASKLKALDILYKMFP